jgi:hypothetical protein
VADVLKFNERAKSDAQRRFAGKLYLRCVDHGRIGGDGRKAIQEYILDNEATTWRSGSKPAGGEPAPGVEPAAVKPAAPAPAVSPKPAEPKPAPAAKQSEPRKSAGLLLS